jgi:hypothetical protein
MEGREVGRRDGEGDEATHDTLCEQQAEAAKLDAAIAANLKDLGYG